MTQDKDVYEASLCAPQRIEISFIPLSFITFSLGDPSSCLLNSLTNISLLPLVRAWWSHICQNIKIGSLDNLPLHPLCAPLLLLHPESIMDLMPTFSLFTHNAGFTDPFLNRERKRHCWNISWWGNRKGGVKNKNSVRTRKKEERFMMRKKAWLKVTLWIYWKNIWKSHVVHIYDLSHLSPR